MTLPPLVRLVLWPLSVLYGAVTRLRVWLYEQDFLKPKRLNRPVISVGNLTVGGTGKTPMVIWLAERLLAEEKRVGILSRGYRGSAETSDEIELMKFRLQNRALFGVGPDRFEQGRKLQETVDVFLLDDGFQHLSLARDVNILLIDAAQPLAKQDLLPAGSLREPISSMGRADLLLFTRSETVPGTAAAIEKFQGYPVFSATTRLLGFRRFGPGIGLLQPDGIGTGPFYAFCGIGNPRAFFQDLQNWKFELTGHCEFADHHRYDARDAAEIQAAARASGAKALLTTEKDVQNLKGIEFAEFPLFIVTIDLEISKEAELLALIHKRLEARSAAA
jgi:tetraacyldisaccharide 4'-kinase